MVFANLIFIYIFLPLNLLLYFITKNKAWRNAVLIAFSMIFTHGANLCGSLCCCFLRSLTIVMGVL